MPVILCFFKGPMPISIVHNNYSYIKLLYLYFYLAKKFNLKLFFFLKSLRVGDIKAWKYRNQTNIIGSRH